MSESFWNSAAAMAIAVVVVAALLGVALFLLIRPQRHAARERIQRFVAPATASGAAMPLDMSELGWLAYFEHKLEGRPRWERFKEMLDIARIETPAVKILAATVAGTPLAALLIPLVTGIVPLALLAAFVPFGVRFFIKRALKKQRNEFADQLADNLQLVVSALRAGQSMAGALAVVADEADEPSRGEFRRIVHDEQAGAPLEDAIRAVARRMDNRDLDQVALVATIQRETGGNTAEVLDRVIETIRERGALRRMMSTLTAQGRLTQIIVSVLPLALLLAITLINPSYMDPLYETGGGHIALALGVLLSVMGSWVIKNIIEIEA